MIFSKINSSTGCGLHRLPGEVLITPRVGDVTCKHQLVSANLGPEDKWKRHLAGNSLTLTAMAPRWHRDGTAMAPLTRGTLKRVE